VSFDLFRRDQAFHRALDLYVLADTLLLLEEGFDAGVLTQPTK
jgi:hypothetical protein